MGSLLNIILPVEASYAWYTLLELMITIMMGKTDILLGAEISKKTRIKIIKIDANYGVLLTGDGKISIICHS